MPLRFLFALLVLPALAACNADDETGDLDDLGQCASPYDASFSGKYPLSALPNGGACAASTECYLPVDTCPVDLALEDGGMNLTEYECECVDGGWRCYAAVVENATCEEGGTEDAAIDGATDAPVDASGDASGDATLDAGDGGG